MGWVRGITLLISLCISSTECINFAARALAFTYFGGWQRASRFGVVEYTFPSLEHTKAHGCVAFGDELTGVVSFALAAVLAGGCIWKRSGWKAYFLISLVGMLGQATGPISKDYFFFASNFFEIFSFGGMVLADYRLFN